MRRGSGVFRWRGDEQRTRRVHGRRRVPSLRAGGARHRRTTAPDDRSPRARKGTVHPNSLNTGPDIANLPRMFPMDTSLINAVTLGNPEAKDKTPRPR